MEELEKMADTIQELKDKVDKFLDKQELNDIQKSIFARKLDEYYWEVLNDDEEEDEDFTDFEDDEEEEEKKKPIKNTPPRDDEEEDEDLDLIENDSNIIKKPQVKIRKSK